MLKQIEGSRAIAEAVARCRPEVVCAYPITPQTHVVEALAELVRTGELARCSYVNVESEFAAMSVAIGASATGARAYTATSSQGLLYMAEAVYNASGLGLPIVMTLGTRAIGAPINIWNDHSDAMALRDAGWVQLFAGSNQDAADLHVLAFRLAEDIDVPVMVCVDGFILTHAVERIDVPSQADVDAFLPPFVPEQRLDPAAPLTIGALVGPEAFTEVKFLAQRKLLRALDRIPALASELGARLGRDVAGLVRGYRTEDAEIVVVSLGSIGGTIADVVDAMRDAGVRVGSLEICTFRPFPRAAVRAAIGRAARVVVLEKNLVLGAEPVLATDVRGALEGLPCRVGAVVAGLGGRPIPGASIRRVVEAARTGDLDDPHFLDLDRAVVTRELPERRMKFYQLDTFTVGDHLRGPADRAIQAANDRTNSITSGHRACQGCGEALGARYVLDAAMRATDGKLVVVNATGCLEVFSTPCPESAWQVPWMHSLFANAASVATGVAAALRAQGKTDVRVLAQGGDGATVDIGLACVSGMFERGDDVLYVCYDNEAYMNTGVQRSGATPFAARTSTTPAVGPQPGNALGTGKSMPLIAMAHGIPYVATASVADVRDLEAKVTRAMSTHGARYLHVHVPCPLGWGSEPDDTIQVARLAVQSGLFPLFEAEAGELVASTSIRRRAPVEDYLRLQRRFAHLFDGSDRAAGDLARIQAIADRNVARFRLDQGDS